MKRISILLAAVIAAGALAATRASSPQVKKRAEQIRGAQDTEITLMKGWLRQWGEPTAMPSMGHDMGHMSGSASSMPGMFNSDMVRSAGCPARRSTGRSSPR